MVDESNMRGHAVEKSAFAWRGEKAHIGGQRRSSRKRSANCAFEWVFEFKGNGNNGPPPVLLSVPTKWSVGSKTSVDVSNISSEGFSGDERAREAPSQIYGDNGQEAVQVVHSPSEVNTGAFKRENTNSIDT
jgi:hypothetical protein